MPEVGWMLERLERTRDLRVLRDVSLSRYTRFGIGGPATVMVEASGEEALSLALETARVSGLPLAVIGGGTNLIVSDAGFSGIVLRYVANQIRVEGSAIRADAGAELQALVDAAVDGGWKGLETLTRIPGSVGAAVYGNAGAYGHSISERVSSVRFLDGREARSIPNAECDFHYRESVFKHRKRWIILSAEFTLEPGDSAALRQAAEEIRRIRDEKYPPDMKCAGSIFKNLIFAELPQAVRVVVPERVIREGKVPSAYFLEQVGAKGMALGGIRVASYHANLIYNAGDGTAAELRTVIEHLKSRVRERYGLELEEEVQYIGF